MQYTKKDEHIIKNATKLFLKQGFSGTSIDELIGLCGGSKRDIYLRFHNKIGLFHAVILSVSEDFQKKLKFDDLDTLRVQESLVKFATNLIKLYTSPKAKNFHKMIFQESKIIPEIAYTYYELGHKEGKRRLSIFFYECQKKGIFTKFSADKLADFFIAIVKDCIHAHTLSNGNKEKSLIDEQNDIAQSIEIFLNGAM